MEFQKLVEWNPWWEDAELVRNLEGLPRPGYKELIYSVEIREITIITGVRRSGKSTLMYQIIGNLLREGVDPKQILFVNLEDKKLIKDSLDDIYAAYRSGLNPDKKAYVFLDEVHKKEGWEAWIRKKYDLKTDNKFVISGSSSYLLKKDYSTLLTGRNITFEVFPLSFKEFLLFKNLVIGEDNLKEGIIVEETRLRIMNYFREYVNIGGFPEISLKQEEYKERLLEQYFDDIIYKDIVDRYNLNSQITKELALYLMANFTSLVSLRGLRNSLGLSYDTIKDYFSHFKEAFLFFTLDFFSYSLKEQKTRPSKIYCVDNGLRNAVSFRISQDDGKLAENLVFLELKRLDKEVFYWKGKAEVDFVVKNSDRSLTGINVTFSEDINEREIKSLLEFKKTFKMARELVLLTKDLEKKERGIRIMPLWKWLLEEKGVKVLHARL